MRVSRPVLILTLLIAFFSLFAAGAGLFWCHDGESFPFTTLRGEEVTIHGTGLYRWDSVSYAAQAMAQDLATLVVGLPLLLGALFLYYRRQLRGTLLLAGTLGYFLYTYASYSFLSAFNQLFLLYVALFSLSLFAFILTLMSIKVSDLPGRFSEKMPRRTIAVFMIVIGTFLILAWLGRIVPSLINGGIPVGLESYTTLVIQALDLGVIAPVCILGAVLLLKKHPWGYLLAALMLLKGLTMLIAITAMVLAMVRAGVEVAAFELVFFPSFMLVNLVLVLRLLTHVVEAEKGA
ncbi:MAG: hypothetical protein E4H13_06415 [Calditrichales bacterium]|nr:MAG: hypothetical protein E4H13_06415 [Calditrichales bacterium]